MIKHFEHPPYDHPTDKCTKCGVNPARMQWDPRYNKSRKRWCFECKQKINDKKRASMRFWGDKMYVGTEKTCSFCGKTWPRLKEHWNKDANSPDRLTKRCRHCKFERCLYANYGIRQIDKVEIHKFQDGRCGICSKELSTNGDACVDHDHSIGWGGCGHSLKGISDEQKRKSVNGLLCGPCNKVFGIVRKIVEKQNITPEQWVVNALEFEKTRPAQHILFPN